MGAHANPRALLAASLLLLGQPLVAQAPPASDAVPAPPSGAPKSLLPDAIDAPVSAEGVTEGAVSVAPDLQPGAAPGFAPVPVGPADPALPEPEPLEEPDPLAELAGPVGDPALAGLLTPATGGADTALFSGSDSRFLATLLSRIDAPLASRWAQILLQRALLSRTIAPPPLNPADWVAARGAALAALGAGADAHRLVSRIAIDRYTARLYAVAAQAALASADPMALCPLSPTARVFLETPTWTLADAMCLSILGDEVGASDLFDRLRRRSEVSAFDIGLAERIGSAAGGSRRGANPEWGEMQGGLTAWRLGLSSAAGLALPDELLATASPAQQAWIARLPGEAIARRAALAPAAAATGALSTAELGRILAAETASLDPAAAGDSPGGLVRTASRAADVADRLAAMKTLWGRAEAGTPAHFGWLLATAPAAARIPVSDTLAGEAPALAASLVAAGLVAPAARWWRAGADGDDRAGLWALLVAVAPEVPVDGGLFDNWAGSVPAHRARLLAAGLQGLGRGDVGSEIARLDNEWTRALDRAVAARRAGEVILLCATGLQGRWADVPPDYLRRIAAALSAVGRPAEARLIVAEAAIRG